MNAAVKTSLADQLAALLAEHLARAGEVLVKHGVAIERISSKPGPTSSPRRADAVLMVDGWAAVFIVSVKLDAGAVVAGSLNTLWSAESLLELGLVELADLVAPSAACRGGAKN